MTVTLDVVLFSYMQRPIFDVFLENTDIGLAGPWPYSGRGSMSGVQLRLGKQTVKWRFADTGEAMAAKNSPELKVIPPEATFLGVHVYEDGSVEITPSQHFPEVSQRGRVYDAQWRQRSGK